MNALLFFSAMDYLSNNVLTPSQGHAEGRAAAVIILANTPQL